MKALLITCLVFVSISAAGAITISDPNVSLSEQQKESISAWLNVLAAVYDNDTSLIPDDPNEIIALETSENPRDLIVWQIFKMLRYELDPNSSPPDKNIPVVSDESNRNPLPFTLTTDIAVNTTETESLQEEQESQQAPAIVSVQSMEQIEELANPLGPRILESKTYRIVTLPLEIEGHVVIPAGTKLIAPFDPNNNIIEVMPGGLLDMGKAVNYSDPNYPVIVPPVEILPEDPNIIWGHNFVGIYVHRGANPATCISNVIVNNCEIGIVLDEQLTYPIRNVITCGCYDGIDVYAPNAIVDSEFLTNGTVWIGPYEYSGAGIYLRLDSIQYPYPAVNISRTVVYFGDVGLWIDAPQTDPNMPLSDPNQLVPSVEVVNSCFVQGLYFGIYKDTEDTSIDVEYCAFGGNEEDSSFPMPFTGCTGLEYDPFYTLGEDKRLYIAQWSEMIDAGYGMAEDGTGTCDYRPDIGRMDIGCHFPIGVSGGFGIPSSPADFNWDGIVDELDLQLMNDCMGAIADPNIVRIDTNYDSRVNLPDFGLMSFDYGYTNDPNLPGSHDPNCERSDFNGDHQVDIEDVAILSEYWLTLVFDEHRICTLCNLHTGADPNDPNAPGGAGVIDQRDMDAFMADWYKQSAFDPNIFIEQTASKVSIAVGNPEPAWKISAFFDDEPVGQWISEELGSSAFDVDLTRYGPGSHRVKIVRNIGYGLEISERIITDPNSTGLYFADIPDTFEPNEPYNIHGFNLNDGELNFKVGNIQKETVYDVNVPSGSVNLEIPSTVFSSSQMAALSIEKSSVTEAGSSDPNGMIFAAAESQEEKYEKILDQKFDREKYRGRGVRFLVLLPSSRVTATYRDAVFAALAAIEKRVPNYPYIVLTRTNVNYDNLKFALYNTFGAKTVIFFGHANSHVGAELINGQNVGGVQRTILQCYSKREGYIWDSYDNVGLASYTRNTNPAAKLLPNSMDNIVLDFTRLLEGSTSRDFVPIDQMYVVGCFSARFPDMALAQGCFGDHDNAYHDMLYCGFTKMVTQDNAEWYFVPGLKELLTHVVQGLVIFFDELGNGKTIPQAVSVLQNQGTDIRQALFGANGNLDNTQGLLDRSSEDDDTMTFYGSGYVSGVRFGLWGQ